jgi:hypothetical protein
MWVSTLLVGIIGTVDLQSKAASYPLVLFASIWCEFNNDRYLIRSVGLGGQWLRSICLSWRAAQCSTSNDDSWGRFCLAGSNWDCDRLRCAIHAKCGLSQLVGLCSVELRLTLGASKPRSSIVEWEPHLPSAFGSSCRKRKRTCLKRGLLTFRRSAAELDELFEKKVKPWRFHKTETEIQIAAKARHLTDRAPETGRG